MQPQTTMARKEHVETLPQASEAVQTIGLVPHGRTVPEVGLQSSVTLLEQLSVAVTLKKTLVPVEELLTRISLPGHESTGGMESTTVTVWVQVALLLQQSMTRQAPCQTVWQGRPPD